MAHEPLSGEQWARIKAALACGNKIEAIKLYREFTSVGLAEAKQAVEKLEGELRVADPEKYPAKGKGCGTALLTVASGVWMYINF